MDKVQKRTYNKYWNDERIKEAIELKQDEFDLPYDEVPTRVQMGLDLSNAIVRKGGNKYLTEVLKLKVKRRGGGLS